MMFPMLKLMLLSWFCPHNALAISPHTNTHTLTLMNAWMIIAWLTSSYHPTRCLSFFPCERGGSRTYVNFMFQLQVSFLSHKVSSLYKNEHLNLNFYVHHRRKLGNSAPVKHFSRSYNANSSSSNNTTHPSYRILDIITSSLTSRFLYMWYFLSGQWFVAR